MTNDELINYPLITEQGQIGYVVEDDERLNIASPYCLQVRSEINSVSGQIQVDEVDVVK